MGKLNGNDPDGFEEMALETAVQACRSNAHVRRPDGRKSTALLLGEEVLRLRKQAENAHCMQSLVEARVDQLNRALTSATSAANVVLDQMKAVKAQRDHQFKSRWFRIGLRLGFYY